MKNNIKAEIIAHSRRAMTGDEIITYKLTFPRIILSEINTYKQIEKNTSSCLSGDSLILVYDGEDFKEIKIKELFNNHKDLKIVSFNEDYSFLLQDISKVFHSGVKPIYRISFNYDYHLYCTEDHRLLKSTDSKNEYVTLKDFNIRQENGKILINSELLNNYFICIDVKEKGNYKYDDLCIDNEDMIFMPQKSVSYSGLVYPEYEIYTPIRITGIEYLGKEDTYDIEVDGKYHNFIANGVVVHNSRAIPVEKMIKVVEEDPFIPLAFQRQHKGMQGTEYITDEKELKSCVELWLDGRDSALSVVDDLIEKGVTKQLANRLLEPFMWVTQLCTGSRESFEHLFEQRCPLYEVDYSTDNGLHFQNYQGKSKKEIIRYFKENNIFFTGENQNDLWWLQHNKGQAEIHFMDLAEKMYDALNESIPDILKEGEWHIPFQEEIWKGKQAEKLEDVIKMSCAMTARISYTTISDNEILTLEKAKKIYDKCVKSGHFSVVSHCAKCMTYEEYENWYKGFMKTTYYFDENGRQHRVMDSGDFHKAKGYNKQLRGFISLRQYVEDGKEITN